MDISISVVEGSSTQLFYNIILPIYRMAVEYEYTFGMIKPESLERKLEDEFLERIRKKKLDIISKQQRTLTKEEIWKLYGHIKEKLPEIYAQMESYLSENPVMLLRIGGINALSRLLEIRGTSNASEAEIGTIRGDYASDQDYGELLRKGMMALNYFHASDTREEADQMLNLFFK